MLSFISIILIFPSVYKLIIIPLNPVISANYYLRKKQIFIWWCFNLILRKNSLQNKAYFKKRVNNTNPSQWTLSTWIHSSHSLEKGRIRYMDPPERFWTLSMITLPLIVICKNRFLSLSLKKISNQILIIYICYLVSLLSWRIIDTPEFQRLRDIK